MASLGQAIAVESVTRVRDLPAVRVLLSRTGADVIMSWYDRTKTILHIDLPIRRSGSFPLFQDFSSIATADKDVGIVFVADSVELQAQKLKRGEVALLLEVRLSLAGDRSKVLETIRITQKGKDLSLSHQNISAEAPKAETEEEATTTDEIEIPELPTLPPSSDDSDSWDIDDLLKDDGK